jgi:hypothetical protein
MVSHLDRGHSVGGAARLVGFCLVQPQLLGGLKRCTRWSNNTSSSTG